MFSSMTKEEILNFFKDTINKVIPTATIITAVEIIFFLSSSVLQSIKNRNIDSSINTETNGTQKVAILIM